MSAQAVSSRTTDRRPVERRNGAAPARRVTPRPRPRVRTVAAAPSARRAPFVVLVVGVLACGLLGLLALNTVLAQGSFRVSELQHRVAALDDQQQALQQRVARLAAPRHLAERAAALGMVPMLEPAFLRERDGVVLGRPQPAPGIPAPAATAPADPPSPAHVAPSPAPAGPATTSGLGPGVAAPDDDPARQPGARTGAGDTQGDRATDTDQGDGQGDGNADGNGNGGEASGP